MNLFLKYMMEKHEMIRLQERVKEMHNPVVKPVVTNEEPATLDAATLGATPRYSVDETEKEEAVAEEKVNTSMLSAFKLRKSKTPKQEQKKVKLQPEVDPDEDSSVDKYSIADSENTRINGHRLKLSPIDEDVLDENIEVSESELLALGKKKKGIRKIFGKKSGLSSI